MAFWGLNERQSIGADGDVMKGKLEVISME